MGAMVAGAPIEEQEKMHAFGLQLGIAFQVQDDYLDAFGDPKTFGKTVGGDIVNNKKTLMYIKALELSDLLQRKALGDLFSLQPVNAAAKIAQVKALFTATGAAAAMQNTIAFYTQNAFSILETMDITAENKKMLTDFGNQLMGRQV
jgi:geranylgeranyl diphosphate synthase type II